MAGCILWGEVDGHAVCFSCSFEFDELFHPYSACLERRPDEGGSGHDFDGSWLFDACFVKGKKMGVLGQGIVQKVQYFLNAGGFSLQYLGRDLTKLRNICHGCFSFRVVYFCCQ